MRLGRLRKQLLDDLREEKGTRIWKMKQWFILSEKLALYLLWTCRNTDYEMNETVQHFPHSRKYKIYISRRCILISSYKVKWLCWYLVFLISWELTALARGPQFCCWNMRFGREKVILWFFWSHRTHNKCFTLFILIFCYILFFNLLKHRLLSPLFKHFVKICMSNSKKTLLYVCFFLFLHTIFLRIFRKSWFTWPVMFVYKILCGCGKFTY